MASVQDLVCAELVGALFMLFSTQNVVTQSVYSNRKQSVVVHRD